MALVFTYLDKNGKPIERKVVPFRGETLDKKEEEKEDSSKKTASK